MNNKGFALIKLLIIIIVFSFALFVVVPKIKTQISDFNKRAFLNNIENLINSAKTDFTSTLLLEPANETIYNYSNGIETKISGNVNLKYKGEKPEDGYLIISDNGNVEATFYKEGLCIVKKKKQEKLLSTQTTKDDCLKDINIDYVITEENE